MGDNAAGIPDNNGNNLICRVFDIYGARSPRKRAEEHGFNKENLFCVGSGYIVRYKRP